MELATIERALKRERASRKLAERLLEEKSRELFDSFRELEGAHEELKQNQQQLVQSEKMASLGVLSAGVAHEINNPIGFVTSNLATLDEYTPVFHEAFLLLKQLLKKLEAEPSCQADYKAVKSFLEEREVDFLVADTSDILAEIHEGLRRVTEIVSSLQSFARADKAIMEPIDIIACVRSTVSLVKSDAKHQFQLVDKLIETPMVIGSTGKLNQVFMNLIVNAVQAVSSIKSDGKVTLRSFVQERFVNVEIGDDGPGIEPALVEKIFEPFFTTKEEGEGTGLGLSLTQGIIREHGGEISVNSQLGIGTKITISIPICDET
ncbi:MAG: sensor histidine kinase [Pseudomonadales bacterium]